MTCEGCSGSGVCDACSGYGYFPDSPETDFSGTDCIVCDGTCECADCDGDGTTDTDTDMDENDISTDERDTDTSVLEMRQ